MNTQAHNPLHGVTLAQMLTELVEECGWVTLGQEIPIRCFTHEPSLASSLKFLRRTPWAREKVESFYLFIQRQKARDGKRPPCP
ncbi:VF530 family protein [Rivihabitans pingtungensis]|uniref:VF530 family protein n=1 Tax=Rivihabitans pingtungensis TaxID=1054498 RepID=UPI002CCA3CAD|nr:VF530 family protein [Rivihabitans pingtungensis]HNX72044.1 VF530 family protein [Rivihabitans pingtungensis]